MSDANTENIMACADPTEEAHPPIAYRTRA